MLTATITTTTFTSGSLQTVSFPGVTWTPKAVKVEVFWVTAADALQDHYSYGRGYSDGTNDASMSWAAEDNLDFSACHRANSTVAARLIDPVNENNEFVMSGSSGGAGPVSGGWQFNVTTPDSVARVMRVTIYGGDDCNAAVRRFTADATWSIADLAFQPNLVEFATVSTTFDDGVTTFHVPSVGWASDNGAGTDQVAVARSNANNSDITSVVALYHQGVCCGQVAAPWTWNISVNSWNANGVSGTGTGSGYDDVACLLLDTGNSSAWVGLVTCPTTTGDTPYDDPGFRPQLLEGCATDLEHPLFDGAHYFDAIGSFGWFNATATEQTCGNPISEDNADITNEATFFSTSALEVHGHDQASVLYEASLTSFDANGWTWNFSNAASTTYAVIVVAIEEDQAGDSVTAGTSDSLTASESQSVSLAGSRAAVESLEASESSSAAASLSRSETETVEAATTQTTSAAVARAGADAITAADSASVDVSENSVNASSQDGLTVDDAAQVVSAQGSRQATEQLEASESLACAAALARSSTVAITATDAASVEVAAEAVTVSAADSVVASDSQSREIQPTRAMSETVAVDTAQTSTAAAQRTASEAVTVTLGHVLSAALSRASADAIAASDQFLGGPGLALSDDDALLASEQTQRAIAVLRGLTDLVSASELPARDVATTARSRSDSATVTEVVLLVPTDALGVQPITSRITFDPTWTLRSTIS